MILQHMGKTQVVYMPDIDAGHIVLGESMGLCDIHGKPEPHATISKAKYTTDCGVTLDAWKMVGETVEVYALPDRVPIKSREGTDVCDALNSFNSPRFDFDRYVFTGKFKGIPGRNTFSDKADRKLTTCTELMKDIPGIYNLMANLGADKGALFQPVIARYMWGIWHQANRPVKHQMVGYLDLHEYLQVMRDDRRNMFSRLNGAALVNIELGKRPSVVVKSVDPKTNQAIVEFDDAVVIDREKDRTFRPFVLIANRPFELPNNLKFRWTKVDFQGHHVFLIPVMSVGGTWSSMLNMVDLLSSKQL